MTNSRKKRLSNNVRRRWRNLAAAGGCRVTVVLQPQEAEALRQLQALFDGEPKATLLSRLMLREAVARGVLTPDQGRPERLTITAAGPALTAAPALSHQTPADPPRDR